MPSGNIVSYASEPNVSYIAWDFGELVNKFNNVETVTDKLLFEVK